MSQQQESLVSQQDYIKAPNQCPVCRSTNIRGGSVHINIGIATQTVHCQECEAEWDDVYNLIGYNLIT